MITKKSASNKVKNLLNKLPYIKTLHNFYVDFYKNSMFYPGHYYSVIPNIDDIKANEARIWEESNSPTINDIDLNSEEQLSLLHDISELSGTFNFPVHKEDGFRYYYQNPMYSYTDAIFLSAIIQLKKPSRIIEIGSGYSSAAILDTQDHFLDYTIDLTFIEPYPERLHSLLQQADRKKVTIIEKKLQDIEFSIFDDLKNNDILFIDSSHVLKTGSDLFFLIFNIIPKLNDGVLIHFHDIFYPLGYTKEIVFSGRNWNESYFLRAFLMNNKDYKILLFSDYLHKFYKEHFSDMSLAYKNTGGNLWIQKI